MAITPWYVGYTIQITFVRIYLHYAFLNRHLPPFIIQAHLSQINLLLKHMNRSLVQKLNGSAKGILMECHGREGRDGETLTQIQQFKLWFRCFRSERCDRKHSSWNWIEAVSYVLGARDEGWRWWVTTGDVCQCCCEDVTEHRMKYFPLVYLCITTMTQPCPRICHRTNRQHYGRTNERRRGVPYGRSSEKCAETTVMKFWIIFHTLDAVPEEQSLFCVAFSQHRRRRYLFICVASFAYYLWAYYEMNYGQGLGPSQRYVCLSENSSSILFSLSFHFTRTFVYNMAPNRMRWGGWMLYFSTRPFARHP